MRGRVIGFGVLTLVTVLWQAHPASAAVPCGSDPADTAAVAQAEAAVAAQCDCCGPATTAKRLFCVVRATRQLVAANDLRRTCVRKVVVESIDACPLGADASNVPCQVCSSDTDCRSGQFCECRGRTCSKAGGVCVAKPQACPEFSLPVCGCDG